MALTQLFTNNAVSLLASPISASDTSLSVISGHGALFPNPGPNEYFLITLEDQAASTREIIRVRSRINDTFFFSLFDRAQEGTTTRSWSASAGNDTLVDHRITAETMRLAMELPEPPVIPPAGIDGIAVQASGITVGATTTTLNFVGAGVSVSDTGLSRTITIPGATSSGGGGSAWINGATVGPTNIITNQTLPISTVDYSIHNRGFKYFITISCPVNGRSMSFDVSATVSGVVSSLTETVEWNMSGRVGDRLLGSLDAVLDTSGNTLSLTWTNAEPLQVEVLCTRIQHGI